jgi:hypothetical protein
MKTLKKVLGITAMAILLLAIIIGLSIYLYIMIFGYILFHPEQFSNSSATEDSSLVFEYKCWDIKLPENYERVYSQFLDIDSAYARYSFSTIKVSEEDMPSFFLYTYSDKNEDFEYLVNQTIDSYISNLTTTNFESRADIVPDLTKDYKWVYYFPGDYNKPNISHKSFLSEFYACFIYMPDEGLLYLADKRFIR